MLIKRNRAGNSRFKLHSQNPDWYKIGYQPDTAKYPVCADGLRKVLKYIKENNKDPKIMVTENGYKETLGEKMYFRMRSTTVTGSITMRHLMALHGAVCCREVMTIRGMTCPALRVLRRSSLISSRMVFH